MATPQDKVKIIGQGKATEIARAKQILRRAAEEKSISPKEAKANARALKAANTPTRTSGLTGRQVGAMDHQGGHGLGGASGINLGGGGRPEQIK